MTSDASQPDQVPPAPFLFFGMADEQEDSRIGVSTGERLHAQHPDVYQRVVHLLGQGAGVREIKRQLGVHHRTIQAVAIREGQTIDTMRRELGARALGVASLAIEALEERIISGGVKPAELSMAAGILIDKGQLLTGGATGRVEKIERHQVEREIDDILDEVETIEAELVPYTGIEPAGNLQIEAPAPAGQPEAAPATGPSADLAATGPDPFTDSESVVLPASAMVNTDPATGSATDQAALQAPDLAPDGEAAGLVAGQGAGGVADLEGGVEFSIVSEPTKLSPTNL